MMPPLFLPSVGSDFRNHQTATLASPCPSLLPFMRTFPLMKALPG